MSIITFGGDENAVAMGIKMQIVRDEV